MPELKDDEAVKAEKAIADLVEALHVISGEITSVADNLDSKTFDLYSTEDADNIVDWIEDEVAYTLESLDTYRIDAETQKDDTIDSLQEIVELALDREEELV